MAITANAAQAVKIVGDWSHVTCTITNSTATDIVAGDVVAQGFEITNAVTIPGGHGVLYSINYRSANTNGTSVDLVLFKQPITCPANSAPWNYSSTDGTNFVGEIHLVTGDFQPFASTNAMAIKTVILPVWAATNSIWCYPICRQAITNVGNDVVTFTFMP